VQAQLWTEYMKDWKKVEYMAFPRIAALAEIAWLPKEKKNYEDFRARLDGVMKFYDALGIHRAVPLDPPKKATKDGSVIETSLSVYNDHAIEFAFDGRSDTFFWAARELKKDDYITLRLKAPLTREATVKVETGGKASKNGDRLEQGELEYSLNGTTWIRVAPFSGGTAIGKIPAATKALRVRVTAPQTFWLILHEISIE
jgi:hexosaminidase